MLPPSTPPPPTIYARNDDMRNLAFHFFWAKMKHQPPPPGGDIREGRVGGWDFLTCQVVMRPHSRLVGNLDFHPDPAVMRHSLWWGHRKPRGQSDLSPSLSDHEATSLVSVEVTWEHKWGVPVPLFQRSTEEPGPPALPSRDKESSPPWVSMEAKGLGVCCHLAVLRQPTPHFPARRCQRKPAKTGLNKVLSLIK